MRMLAEYLTLFVLLQLGRVHLEPLTLNIPKKSFVVETNDESYVAYLADIINALLSSSSNDDGEYVLQTFSESDVPIAITSNSLVEIQENIRSLEVYDNQNCSTRGINSLALYSALNSSASRSLVVVISDTAAESEGTFIPEILDLIQKKQLRVIFLVSDECSGESHDGLRLMEEITEVSSGVIFSLEAQDIGQVIRFIQSFDYGDDVSLLSPTLSTPGVSAYQLHVDDSVEQVVVVLSGFEPIISIADIEGRKFEVGQDFEYIVNSNKLQIIILENIIPGEYALSVFSSSDSLVQAIGFAPSPIDIKYRFYYKKTVDMTQATERPYTVQGSTNFMLIQIENAETNEWHSHEIIHQVEFVSLVGEVLPKYSFTMGSSNFVTKEDANHAHYVLQIEPPDDHFYVRVRGITKNQPFQRSSKVAYSQWRPVPSRPSSFIVFEVQDCDYEAIWYEPEQTFTKSLVGYKFSFGMATDTSLDFQLPSNVTSYKVNQLAKGLTYVFTVAAINEAGVGESISVTVVTPSAKPLAPPVNIRLIQSTDSLIEIAWQPPAADRRGGKIIRYTTIHFLMSEPWKRYRFNSSKSHVVFKNLRANSEYGFQIAAQTIMGQGPYSQTAFFKTHSSDISSSVSPVTTTIQPHVDIDSALQGPSELKSVDQKRNESSKPTQLNVTTTHVIDNTELEATVIPDAASTTTDAVHLDGESTTQSSKEDSQPENRLVFEVEVRTNVSAAVEGIPANELDEDVDDVTGVKRSEEGVTRGDAGEYDDFSFNNSLARIIAYPVNDQGEMGPSNGEHSGSFITLEKKLEDVTQPVKGRVVFLCRIKGSPTVNYSWYLDNKLIVERSGRVREKMIPHRGMRLTIRDLALVDQGIYTCRGENEVGKVETSAVLNVRFGPTGIVTDLQALDVSSNAVTIKWFPPLLAPSDGPLLRYVVYIYKLSLPSETYKFDTNVTELVYENLDSNTEYVFRVRAVTSKGIGPYSSLFVKTASEDSDVDIESKTDKNEDTAVVVFGGDAEDKPVIEDKSTDTSDSKDDDQSQIKAGSDDTDSKDVVTEMVETNEGRDEDTDDVETVTSAVAAETTEDETETVKEETDGVTELEHPDENESDEVTPEPVGTDTDNGGAYPVPPEIQESEPIDNEDEIETEQPVETTDDGMVGGRSDDVEQDGDSDEGPQEFAEVDGNAKPTEESSSEEIDGTDDSDEERPELEINQPYDIDSGAEAVTDTQDAESPTAVPNYNGHVDDNEAGLDESPGVTESLGMDVDATEEPVELGHEADNGYIPVKNDDDQSLPVVTNGDKLTVEEDEETTTDENMTDDEEEIKEDEDEVTDEGQETGVVDEVVHMTVAAPLQHRVIDYNGKATLRCFVTGYPLPTYEWYHEGKKIPVVRGRIKDRVFGWGSRIIIKNTTEADRGRYTCVAKNSAGERTLEGTVSVRGVEQVEDINVIIMSPTEALVEWKTPRYIASGSTYIIRFYTEDNRGLKFHFSTTRTEAYYRGLLPDTAYTFRVKMQRGDRSGVFSNPITVRTFPLAPDEKPTMVPKVLETTNTPPPIIVSTTSSSDDRIVVHSTTQSADEDQETIHVTTPLRHDEVESTTDVPEEADETSSKIVEQMPVTDAPDTMIVTAAPEPVVENSAPEPMAETAAPEPIAETDAPAPMVETDAPAPMVETAAPEPIAETDSLEPIVETDAPAPMVETAAPEPIAETGAPEPIAETDAPVPMAETAAPEPFPETDAPESMTETAAPEPMVETDAPESMTETAAPEPMVETNAPEPMAETAAPESMIETDAPETDDPVINGSPEESPDAPVEMITSEKIQPTASLEKNSEATEEPILQTTSPADSNLQTTLKPTEDNKPETRGPIADDGSYIRLIRPMESVTAIVGERVILRCLVDANPPGTFLWHKDGDPLKSGSKIRQRKFLKGSMLTFKSISMADAGMYTCIALNSNVVETSGNVTVIPKGGTTTQKPEAGSSHTVMKRSVKPGRNKDEDVEPSASYASTRTYTTRLPSLMEEAFVTPDAEAPKVTRVSQHDPQVAQPDDTTVVVRVTGIEPENVDEERVEEAKTDTLGSLNARPSQTWDSSRSGEPYVEIKKYMDEQSVEVGDRVVFLCRIIGNPDPRFLWYKDGAPLVFDDSRMKERVFDIGSRFTIKRALLSDAGIYTCYGLNDYQTVSMRATLEVFNKYVNPFQPATTSPRTKPNTKPRTKPPNTPLISYRPTDPFTPMATNSYTKKNDCIGEISKLCLTAEMVGKNIDINERSSLRCQIYGDPQPEYRWYRNGVRVYPSKLGPIREKAFPWGSRLAFRGAMESDSGEYRCLAINAAGIKETKAWLLVGPYATIPPRVVTEAPATTVEAYRPTIAQTHTRPRPPKKTPRPTAPRPPKPTTQRIEPTEVFQPPRTTRPSTQVKCIPGSNGELCYSNMLSQVGEVGGAVVFQCKFTGNPDPDFTWFKNGVLIIMEEDETVDSADMARVRIKTMPWGSRLVIRDLVYADAGTYFCVGSNVVSHIVQADLKVVRASAKPQPKPPKNKPPKTTNTPKPKPQRPRTPRPVEPRPQKPRTARPVAPRPTTPVYRPDYGTGDNGRRQPEGSPDGGRCVVYTGTTCRRYLRTQMVYVDGGVDLYSIDSQLRATLQTLSAVDMQCMSYLEPFLCFKAFPPCDDNGNSKSLCQEDCAVLTRSYCRDLTDLKDVYPGRYLWMPSYDDCRSLPSAKLDSDCITVGLTDSNSNRSPTAGTKPDGKCEPYNTDGICSEYVGSRNTFIKTGFTLESIETTVMSIFTAALTLGSVSRECSNYLLPYICLRSLPPCNRNGRPLEVCREDCEVLSNDVCREDFKATLDSDAVDNSLFKLNDCLSLPAESAKVSCTTLSISQEFRATQTDVVFPTSPQPTRNCEPYKGTVCSKYLSGRTVYLDRGQSQSELEDEVSKVQELLAREADMDATCESYLFKEICLTMLPVCNSRGKKREVCREECSQLHNDYCYKDYKTVKVLLRGRDDVLADCTTLPSTSDIRGPTCVELGVSSLPEVAPQVEVDLEMDSNERQTSTVALRCRVTGSPRPVIEWSKDGETLQSTSNIAVEKNKVRIRVISEQEAGTYTCTARNSAGSDKQNMLIHFV